jgi:hypothetical protein
MPATKKTCFNTVLSALLTSVVIPVLLALVSRILEAGAYLPNTGEPPPAHDRNPTALTSAAPVRTLVVAQGLGRSREDAIQDALRNALRQAASDLAEGPAAGGGGPPSIAGSKGGAGRVVRYEDLGLKKEGQPGRELYRQEVLVEVARQPLIDRLQSGARPSR